MPCRYDPGPEDHLRTELERNKKLRKDLDRLTHENDQLREALLRLITEENYVLPAPAFERIAETQTKHRQEDLDRLESAIRELIGNDVDHVRLTPSNIELNLFEALGRVLTADPGKALEPQLGFDPDVL